MSDAKDIAVAIVVAKRRIQAGEWVWVNYAPEDQTLAVWAKRFSCTCCQCRGQEAMGVRVRVKL